MFRKSCGSCHFTNLQRPSDITLADFWGWEKTDKNINKDNKGVSLIFVNTEKGRDLFDAVKDRMIIVPAELENCIQPQLKNPVSLSPLSDEFVDDYLSNGFEETYQKYNKDEKSIYYLKVFKRVWHKGKVIIRELLIGHKNKEISN